MYTVQWLLLLVTKYNSDILYLMIMEGDDDKEIKLHNIKKY